MGNIVTIGADIGGSHITAGIVDLQSRSLIPETLVREKLDSQSDTYTIIKIWANVIRKVASHRPYTGIQLGIAMPGPFDYEKGISMMHGQSKYDSLFGLNVKTLLAYALGILPEKIIMMNDAACFLKGEVYGGAALNYSRVVGLTLGTGLGSAVYDSSSAYDADLWRHPFLESIAEDYISSRWFVNRYKQLYSLDIKDVKELVEQAETHKDHVAKIFEEFGTNLGLFLVEFISMKEAEAVVLGGNIAKAFDHFSLVTKQVMIENGIDVPLMPAKLGENAAIIGAASLWAN
ncbi:MAG: ROK family protein [Sphingobacteriales bacterium]|nr:MAG: ROK family protein [Sphingobacteriales bacterium]